MAGVAFLFPGQGSQYVGMGKELYDNFRMAREVFEEADESLNFDLSGLCFQGPEEKLILTPYTQPAVLTVSIAAWKVLSTETEIKASCLAGHSLGEYTALIAASSLGFADGVKIVHQRGRYMEEAVPLGIGSMAAILGMEREKVEEICEEAAQGEIVSAANFNAPGQVVISGQVGAINRAIDLARQKGAKKAIPLSVSGPFHSSLMRRAGEKLALELKEISLKEMEIPVISNVTAEVIPNKEKIKELLVKQVSHPVRWEESMHTLLNRGIKKVIELGPGKVLSGLMKRINKEIEILNLEESKDLRYIKRELEIGKVNHGTSGKGSYSYRRGAGNWQGYRPFLSGKRGKYRSS